MSKIGAMTRTYINQSPYDGGLFVGDAAYNSAGNRIQANNPDGPVINFIAAIAGPADYFGSIFSNHETDRTMGICLQVCIECTAGIILMILFSIN